MKTLFIFSLVLAVGFYIFVRYLERTNVFFPYKIIEHTPDEIGLEYEDVWLDTQDGVRLHGWFVPHTQAKATVLFLHGNAGNIGDRLHRLALFHSMGLNSFILDYRGYGKSEGSPTEKGLYRDVYAAHAYLKKRDNIGQIIVFGSSLGGVYAVDLASKKDIDALVIEATFTSAQELAHVYYPWIPSFLVSLKMNSIDKIREVTVPKIFFHSRTDRVIPYTLGQRLFDAAPQPKEFVTIVGEHVEGHHDTEDIQKKALHRFFQEEGFLP